MFLKKNPHFFSAPFMHRASRALFQTYDERCKQNVPNICSYYCYSRQRMRRSPNSLIGGKSQRPFMSDDSLTTFSTSSYSSLVKEPQCQSYIDSHDKSIYDTLQTDMQVIPNFLNEEDEKSLLDEVDKYMKRLRYEYDHWDNAIHGFRETEKKSWNNANQAILERVRSLAFHSATSPLAYVHVLDISKDGYIKPHVDAVRFCGDTITGMCLLSSCVMRLALEKDSSKFGDVYLPQRSLYIMKNKARYDFTHEILKQEDSKFKGHVILRDRRISIICRNEPKPEDTQ